MSIVWCGVFFGAGANLCLHPFMDSLSPFDTVTKDQNAFLWSKGFNPTSIGQVCNLTSQNVT
jgi:hypothetical protein